jgi:hypothetical protein
LGWAGFVCVRYGSFMGLYRIRQIVLDVNRVDLLASFWCGALGYVLDHRAPGYASLRDPDGLDPILFLQEVPEGKTGKNRAHIDIEVDDEAAVVARLVGLGATVLWRNDSDTWTAMADPGGNEFCVGRFTSAGTG